MPFGLNDKDIRLMTEVFQLHPGVREVLIFGSRAMGTERPGSDIDLAIKGESIALADILKIRTQLDELPIAYECDVVDYDAIVNSTFKKHIDQHGMVFYLKSENTEN